MSSWIKIKGTQTGSFQLGLTGPALNNVNGNLEIKNSGNTTYVDITSANITSNGGVFSGNAAGLINIPGANVSGQVGNATVAGTVYTNAQPNITSVGTLANLTVTANITSGNANLGNLVGANYFAGVLTTASQPNVTSIGTLANLAVNGMSNLANVTFNGVVTGNIIPSANVTYSLGNATNRFKDLWISGSTIQLGNSNISASGNGLALPSANVTNDLNVGGNAVISGNLTVSGTMTYVNTTNTSLTDPIIELGGGANGAALTNSDGLDRGALLHYHNGNIPVDAFMGWKAANSEFTFASSANVSNNVASISILGNIRAGVVIANLSGNATTSGTVVTNAQPNITSVGTLASLTVTANITGGNASLGNLVTSNYFAGVLTTGAQPNITSIGTLGNISVTSTANIGTLAVTGSANLGSVGNLIITGGSTGQVLTFGANGLSWTTISSTYGNSNVASYLPTYSGNISASYFIGSGNNLSNIQGANVTGNVGNALNAYSVAVANVTGIGNIATINKDGNASNILYGNGVFAAAPNSSGGVTDYWRATTKSFVYNSSSTITVMTLPAGATVDRVTVIVDSAFNGNTPSATVGLSTGTGLEYVGTGDIDLKTADRYDLPCQLYPANIANVVINYTASNSSAGSARVIITYAVTS